MNLVSLIDVFTILIFFLMSNVGVETISSTRAVQLPESMSQKPPKETVMVVVTGTEILVGGKVVASVAEALRVDSDLIQPLKAELDVEASREVILKENEGDSKRVTIMDPVGYKRINKRTGKEIDGDDIVKGIKQPDGEYVVLSEEEIKEAYPVSTQTIEIETFVPAGEIPFTYLEKPYYLAPLAKGEKVYALLRDAMKAAQVIGIGRVVMHSCASR